MNALESGPARLPDGEGVAVSDGVPLAWASYGDGPTTVLLMPAWSIVNSRMWKAQVAYLARHVRVVTFDGRGSGRSGRPLDAAGYTDEQYADDTVAVLDAAGVDRAVLVGLSCGASWSIRVAAGHPDRVQGIVAIGAACGFPVAHPERDQYVWSQRYEAYEGWAKYNKHHWLNGGYDDFVRFFMAEMFPEPHSTKQIEDATGWGLDVEPEVLAAATAGRLGCDGATCTPLEPLCARVRCPVLAIHGTDDHVRTHAISERLAELTGAEWGMVSAGCAAAMSHATAACVAGGNPDLHVRIPNLAGFPRDEVIIPTHSRNVYDAAIRAVGVKIIEVDSPEALQLAIGPKTAMIYLFAGPRTDSGPMSTEAICGIAKQYKVPVFVDAAA